MKNPPKLPSLEPPYRRVKGGSLQSEAPAALDTSFSDDVDVASSVPMFDALHAERKSPRPSVKGGSHHRTVRHVLSRAAAEARAKKS